MTVEVAAVLFCDGTEGEIAPGLQTEIATCLQLGGLQVHVTAALQVKVGPSAEARSFPGGIAPAALFAVTASAGGLLGGDVKLTSCNGGEGLTGCDIGIVDAEVFTGLQGEVAACLELGMLTLTQGMMGQVALGAEAEVVGGDHLPVEVEEVALGGELDVLPGKTPTQVGDVFGGSNAQAGSGDQIGVYEVDAFIGAEAELPAALQPGFGLGGGTGAAFGSCIGLGVEEADEGNGTARIQSQVLPGLQGAAGEGNSPLGGNAEVLPGLDGTADLGGTAGAQFLGDGLVELDGNNAVEVAHTNGTGVFGAGFVHTLLLQGTEAEVTTDIKLGTAAEVKLAANDTGIAAGFEGEILAGELAGDDPGFSFFCTGGDAGKTIADLLAVAGAGAFLETGQGEFTGSFKVYVLPLTLYCSEGEVFAG